MSRRYTRNIDNVVNNRYQRFEKHPRVVTVCSGGCLRSPTAAVVLSQEPYNYNTRSVGIDESWAITILDEVLLRWADEFVVMDEWMQLNIQNRLDEHNLNTPIVNLDIEDNYGYRDSELMILISVKYDEATGRYKEDDS